MFDEKEKTEDEMELETLEVETLLVESEVNPVISLDSKQLASRQLAHDIKVANFKAGGKF